VGLEELIEEGLDFLALLPPQKEQDLLAAHRSDPSASLALADQSDCHARQNF
jgi:hypothetical protein